MQTKSFLPLVMLMALTYGLFSCNDEEKLYQKDYTLDMLDGTWLWETIDGELATAKQIAASTIKDGREIYGCFKDGTEWVIEENIVRIDKDVVTFSGENTYKYKIVDLSPISFVMDEIATGERHTARRQIDDYSESILGTWKSDSVLIPHSGKKACITDTYTTDSVYGILEFQDTTIHYKDRYYLQGSLLASVGKRSRCSLISINNEYMDMVDLPDSLSNDFFRFQFKRQ